MKGKLIVIEGLDGSGKSTQEALLKERYTNQLSYYSKAIEAMLGKAPDEVIIFSLALGKEIRIDV